MQCHEMRYPDLSLKTPKSGAKPIKTEKEVIHSGHFMISHFEAEAQDDEYEVAVPVPEIKNSDLVVPQDSDLQVFNVNKTHNQATAIGQLAIETSFTKLFQCMSLAYRQKLTSPKWNRFKGIRLRWKDKIRLNNVIWRCWHMQFIKKENTLICQFASPLDEGTHNKPEAVVLEGKYWKRKLAAVTAEYKRWRMFYRNKIMGWANKDMPMPDADMFEWQSHSTQNSHFGNMMIDEDYMDLMSDTFFSTITFNQPFAFPDTREIARGASLADFIQPSLMQLQPNLDDFVDELGSFQEVYSPKLPPVPEECGISELPFRSNQSFTEMTLENQASILKQPYVLQTPQTTYQPLNNFSENLPVEPLNETKTTKFYQSKPNSPKPIHSPTLSNAGASQPFIRTETFSSSDLLTGPGDVSTSYKCETKSAVSNVYSSENIQQQQQQFKILPTSSKIGCKPAHYSKLSTSSPPSNQYNRVLQNYNLPTNSQGAVIPEMPSPSVMAKDIVRSSSLPEVNKTEKFVMPKQQHTTNFKTRQRTRSGSSILMLKSKPPLCSANSDSAINISSALLAQLLTTNNSGVYNIAPQDKVQVIEPKIKSTNVPIMPSPPKIPQQKILSASHSNTLLITNPSFISQNYLTTVSTIPSPESPIDGNRVQNSSSSECLSHSPTSQLAFSGPISPQKQENSSKPAVASNEHRRVCHINAEQKRRCNIKNGFDVLHTLIPHLSLNPNFKLSKAVMLQKGAEYIRQLQAERLKAQEDIEALKYQIESLNSSISNCQSMLPATGAPVSHHRTTKMKEMFDDFVRVRTLENWKFWIFSLLFEPLLQSFSCSVSTSSYEDLCRSTLIWVEQHCSLVELRPAVLNSLRKLSTATEILFNPSKLPEEARIAVSKKKSNNE